MLRSTLLILLGTSLCWAQEAPKKGKFDLVVGLQSNLEADKLEKAADEVSQASGESERNFSLTSQDLEQIREAKKKLEAKRKELLKTKAPAHGATGLTTPYLNVHSQLRQAERALIEIEVDEYLSKNRNYEAHIEFLEKEKGAQEVRYALVVYSIRLLERTLDEALSVLTGEKERSVGFSFKSVNETIGKIDQKIKVLDERLARNSTRPVNDVASLKSDALRVTELALKAAALVEEGEQLRAENTDVSKERDDLRVKLKEVGDLLTEANKSIRLMEGQLQEVQSANSSLVQSNKNLTQLTAQQRHALAELSGQHSATLKNLTAASNELQIAQKRLNAINAEIAARTDRKEKSKMGNWWPGNWDMFNSPDWEKLIKEKEEAEKAKP